MDDNTLAVNQNNFQGGDNKFEIFNYNNLGSVRTYIKPDGSKWFCLNDVCEILGIRNVGDVKTRLNTPYIDTIDVGVQTGLKADGTPAIQYVPMIFIDEGNLYNAIGNSRKPEAKNFMNWIYREVIPSLAKRGYYVMNDISPTELLKQMVNQISSNTNNITILFDTVDNHSRSINQINDKLAILNQEGYHTIKSYAVYRNLPLTLELAQFLGQVASKICNDRGIHVISTVHPTWGSVNMYPLFILEEVFNKHYNKIE